MSDALGFFDPNQDAEQAQISRRRAYAQALLQSGMGNPGSSPGAGLADAGKTILGAILSSRADKADSDLSTKKNQAIAKMLGIDLGNPGADRQPMDEKPDTAMTQNPIGPALINSMGSPGPMGGLSSPAPTPSPQLSNTTPSGPVGGPMATDAPAPTGLGGEAPIPVPQPKPTPEMMAAPSNNGPALASAMLSNNPTPMAAPQAAAPVPNQGTKPPGPDLQKLAEYLAMTGHGDQAKALLEGVSFQTPQQRADMQVDVATRSRETPEYAKSIAEANREPLDYVAAKAEAGREPIPEAASRAGAISQANLPAQEKIAQIRADAAAQTAAGGKWQILTDPSSQQQYRYNPETSQATTLDGKPYAPGGAQKIGGGVGRSGLAMAMQKFMQENPNATADDIARYAGIYGKTVAAVGAGTKSDASSLGNITKLFDASTAQEQSMKGAISQVTALMNKGAGTNAGPIINRWLQAGRKATGDADVAAFDTAIRTAANEYGKIISGATGAGGSTDASRAEASVMLDKFQTPAAILAQLGVIQRDAGFKIKSYADQRDQINGRISGNNPAAGQVSTPTPQQPVPAKKSVRFEDLP